MYIIRSRTIGAQNYDETAFLFKIFNVEHFLKVKKNPIAKFTI